MRVRAACIWVGTVSVGGSVATAAPAAYVGRVLYALGDRLPAGIHGYATDPGVSQVAAGGQVAGGGFVPPPGGDQTPPLAVLWSGPDGTAINLNPASAGAVSSFVEGTNGTQQVGYANSVNRSGNDHAILWKGSAASYVDLNPSPTGPLGFIDNSDALATDGAHQVGWGYGATTNGSVHAMVWAGTAASAVDLSPANLTGYEDTFAYGVRGTQQVGLGFGTATNQNYHAMLWAGTAASARDLNPTDLGAIDTSFLNDTTGGQQVGAIAGDATGGAVHAALWAGTAGSAVDLNPAAAANSVVNGTNGAVQVGVTFDDASAPVDHALLWTGSAASAVSLDEALPAAGTWTASDAYTVDAAGTVYGTAAGTYNGSAGVFAVAWSPAAVPEPTASAAAVGAAGLLGRRVRARERRRRGATSSGEAGV